MYSFVLIYGLMRNKMVLIERKATAYVDAVTRLLQFINNGIIFDLAPSRNDDLKLL